MAAAAERQAFALVLPEKLVGQTVVIESADDTQMKLRVLGSEQFFIVGANGLYISEALR